MTDPQIRRRLERLLAGEFDPGHLDRIFLFARDRNDGRETIQEIGDFVAHHSERTKGVLTRSARRAFDIIQFSMDSLANNVMYRDDISLRFPRTLRGVHELLDDKTLQARTGFNKKRSFKLLERALAKINPHPNRDRLILTEPLTTNEYSVVRGLTGILVTAPAFKSDRLIDDFYAVLRSNGLLTKDEVRQLSYINHAIVLHAIACMHQSTIIIDNITTATVRASIFQDCLSIFFDATYKYKLDEKEVSSILFQTSLIAIDHLDASLSINELWDYPIAVNKNMKLERL
ncbi:MAG: hypothetical protein QM651_17290 [Rhodoblastus sp.]